MTVGRRRFLQGAAVSLGASATGAAVAGGIASAPAAAKDTDKPAAAPSIAFHGAHQAGIITERQNAAAYVAFDLTARNRAELADTLRVLTERARMLCSGYTPQQLGISAPPSDSGILGAPVPADSLTITVGLGSTAFDQRYGLASAKPKHLRIMDTFVNDNLDRTICDGDVLVQIAASNSDAVIHALRDITKHTRGVLQARWRISGFVPPARPSGTPRNLLGFKDGTANPDITDPATMNRLVWVQPGSTEPAWAVGGSYLVVRVIKMFAEFWDRVTIVEQENMIGRRRDSGAPLSGSKESDTPNYTNDPMGSTTPLDSHIRVANPRTKATDDSRILRRAYNYDLGVDDNGNLDMGLIFTCFQQDLDRQFVAVQKRLADEPLVDYISPVGGGYFFALPGVRDGSDFYGSALLRA